MSKKRGNPNFSSSNSADEVSLGTEAWNVADGFTKIKILRQLILLDEYETIAQYGVSGMDEMILEKDLIAKKREEALNRFVSTLRQLLGNVKFAIKDGDKGKIEDYIKRLNNIDKVLGGVLFVYEDFITHSRELIINEEHFNKILKILRQIKDEINIPINNAGLIFRESGEIDLDKMMQDIVQGG